MKTILVSLAFVLLSGCAVAHGPYPYYNPYVNRYGYQTQYADTYYRYQLMLQQNSRSYAAPFNGSPCAGIQDQVAYEWCKANEREIRKEQVRRYIGE